MFLSFAWLIVAIFGALYIAIYRARRFVVLTPRQTWFTLKSHWETRKHAPNMWSDLRWDFFSFLALLCLPLYLHVPVAGRLGCLIWAVLFFLWSWAAAHRYRPRYLTGVACVLFGLMFLSQAIDPALGVEAGATLGMGLLLIGLDMFLVDREINRAQRRAPAKR